MYSTMWLPFSFDAQLQCDRKDFVIVSVIKLEKKLLYTWT